VGVVVSGAGDASFAGELIQAMGWHRHWDRAAATASATS
jgi:hypothetical protein